MICCHALREQQFDTHQDWMMDVAAAVSECSRGRQGRAAATTAVLVYAGRTTSPHDGAQFNGNDGEERFPPQWCIGGRIDYGMPLNRDASTGMKEPSRACRLTTTVLLRRKTSPRIHGRSSLNSVQVGRIGWPRTTRKCRRIDPRCLRKGVGTTQDELISMFRKHPSKHSLIENIDYSYCDT